MHNVFPQDSSPFPWMCSLSDSSSLWTYLTLFEVMGPGGGARVSPTAGVSPHFKGGSFPFPTQCFTPLQCFLNVFFLSFLF